MGTECDVRKGHTLLRRAPYGRALEGKVSNTTPIILRNVLFILFVLTALTRNNMEPRQRMQTYYGYAFESYCTSEVPESKARRAGQPLNAPPGWGGDVDTNVQWCSVVRTKLGNTRIILGGEVDCIRGGLLTCGFTTWLHANFVV